jgi:hypothetical protein
MKNSIHSWVRTLKDMWDLGRLCFPVGSERETQNITTLLLSLACCFVLLFTLSWMDAIACNALFSHMTGEEIAAGVVKASALKEWSCTEVYESQESTIEKELLSCARDGIDAVINYVGSSTNWELQAYYEHLRTVREIQIKEWQQRSVQTKQENCIITFKNKYSFWAFYQWKMYILSFFSFLAFTWRLYGDFLFILIFCKWIRRYLIRRSALPLSLNFTFIGVLNFCLF